MIVEIKTAGLEYLQSVLKLYRSAKYYREKEILSRKFLDHSIEAGRLITEVSECPEDKESKLAQNALDELNKALFVLKVMTAESIYPQRKVMPVQKLGEQIKELLGLYIVEEGESASAPAEQKVAEQQVMEQPVAVQNSEVPLLPMDHGGFEEIYTGKL